MADGASTLQRTKIGDQFRADGYYSPIRVMSEGDALRYRERLEESEKVRGRQLSRTENSMPHFLFDWAAEIVRLPAILDAVEPIVGPDILVWDAVMFTKEPGGAEHITWHQDLAYWGLDPSDQIITAWIALSPSTLESGCMRVVRGSNVLPIIAHVPGDAPGNLLGRGQSAQVDIDDKDIVDIVLKPGEMSLHDVYILHGSESNRSSDRRLGFGIRYFPPHVKQMVPARDVAFLARGKDRYGHFDLVPAPRASDSEEAKAAHSAARAARAATKKYISNPQDPDALKYSRKGAGMA